MSRGDEIGKLRKKCDVCGEKLCHPKGRGRPRRYCSPECERDGRLERRRERHEEEQAFVACAAPNDGDCLASMTIDELEDEFLPESTHARFEPGNG